MNLWIILMKYSHIPYFVDECLILFDECHLVHKNALKMFYLIWTCNAHECIWGWTFMFFKIHEYFTSFIISSESYIHHLMNVCGSSNSNELTIFIIHNNDKNIGSKYLVYKYIHKVEGIYHFPTYPPYSSNKILFCKLAPMGFLHLISCREC